MSTHQQCTIEDIQQGGGGSPVQMQPTKKYHIHTQQNARMQTVYIPVKRRFAGCHPSMAWEGRGMWGGGTPPVQRRPSRPPWTDPWPPSCAGAAAASCCGSPYCLEASPCRCSTDKMCTGQGRTPGLQAHAWLVNVTWDRGADSYVRVKVLGFSMVQCAAERALAASF